MTKLLSIPGRLLSASGRLLAIDPLAVLEPWPAAASIDYAGTLIAAAGLTNATQQGGITTFESCLKAAGILSDASRADCLDLAMYLIVGGTSAQHAFNFIDPAACPLTFYGSPLHGPTGIQWNGNQHADTGIAANLLDPQQAGLAVYTRSGAAGSGDSQDLGAQGNGSGLFISTANALVGGQPFARLAGNDQAAAGAQGPGLFTTQAAPDPAKPNGIFTRFRRNGGSILDGDGTAAPLSSYSIFLGALNLAGSRYGGTVREACFYAIRRRAYTMQQEVALYNAVQELQTTLNRAV